MISRGIHGLPVPLGAAFRQREVRAEYRGISGKRPVTWCVSAIDTRRGPMVEARFHLSPSIIVATDLAHHSFLEDVLARTAPLLDSDDGWQRLTVQPCRVDGCSRPRPMYDHARRGAHEGGECLVCATRSILACDECGAPDRGHWIGRDAFLLGGVCFDCSTWRKRVADDPQVVTPDFTIYRIGNGRGRSDCKGFAGAKWTVTFTDGRVVKTDDLWYQGKAPEWFHDRLTPNAEVVSGWSS